MKRKAVEGARVIDRGSGRPAVIYRDIGELTPNPKNPRVHSPRQLKQLAQYRGLRLRHPILVDAQSGILAGHVGYSRPGSSISSMFPPSHLIT